MAADQRSFGGLLRRYRVMAGLTQAGLAERAGLSLRGVSDLERGLRRLPYPKTVERLVEALALGPRERDALFAAKRPLLPGVQPDQAGLLPRSQLPVSLTSFVGREAELNEVKQLLATVRLVTLTGVGGCGKTRLAIEIARSVEHRYPGGVWLVGLAPLSDPALVPDNVGAALGARAVAGQSTSAAIAARIGSGAVLLVLDNCEHVLAASAQFIDSLLCTCADLQVLATSREPLGIAGELVWRVSPLTVPDPRRQSSLSELRVNPAVRLFLERSVARQPRFTLTQQNARAIAQICQRLDGIPLALELAAARVEALTADELAMRLDEQFGLLTGGNRAAPPRQQTLRATLDWSYDLLHETECRVFARMSVFAGGCSLEAAEAVCAGEDIMREDVAGLTSRLVNKSLIVADLAADGASRYQLLETVRAYAHDRLQTAGDDKSVRRKHADYFVAFQDALRGDSPASRRWLRGTAGLRWAALDSHVLDHIELEQENLRTALRWSVESGQAEHAVSLAEALYQIADIRGSSNEGYAWLQALMAVPAVAESPAFRERLLPLVATLANRRGDFANAIACYNQQLAAYTTHGDRLGIANALCALSTVYFDQGDCVTARVYIDQCEALAAGLDDNDLARNWRTRAGQVALCEGRLAEARNLIQDAMTFIDPRSAVWGYNCKDLAWIALEQGAYPEAESFLQNAIDLAEERGGEKLLLANTLEVLANVWAAQGRHDRALTLEGALSALCEVAGLQTQPVWKRMHYRWLARSRAELNEADAAAAHAVGRAMSMQEVVDYARASFRAPPDLPMGSRQRAQTALQDRLSPRERQVATLVAEGLTNPQIADRLAVTQRTVAAHIEHILNKLGFTSRTQIGVWASQRGSPGGPPPARVS